MRVSCFTQTDFHGLILKLKDCFSSTFFTQLFPATAWFKPATLQMKVWFLNCSELYHTKFTPQCKIRGMSDRFSDHLFNNTAQSTHFALQFNLVIVLFYSIQTYKTPHTPVHRAPRKHRSLFKYEQNKFLLGRVLKLWKCHHEFTLVLTLKKRLF